MNLLQIKNIYNCYYIDTDGNGLSGKIIDYYANIYAYSINGRKFRKETFNLLDNKYYL